VVGVYDAQEDERKETVIGRDRVPESWLGQTMIVEVKGRKGGRYMVLGRLHDVTDQGVVIDSPVSECLRTYPWESVSDVRRPQHA
jgi:hypothetical protein